MKVRVPTVARVLGSDYRIQYLHNMPGLHGETVLASKIIKISTEHPSREELLATIFHETIHAVLWESGMSSVIGDDDKEEGVVRALENALKTQFKISSGIYSQFTSIILTGNHHD